MNTLIFQYINNLSSNPLIAKLAPIFADVPIFFLPCFLSFMWLYYTYKQENKEHKIVLLNIFYAVVIALMVSILIQQFVDVERPETAITNAGKLLLEHIPDASFPSDHSTVSFAFLTALFLAGFKKVFWAFLPWVILMNLYRIIAGVHWPLDIFAGMLVGVISTYLSFPYLSTNKFASKLNLFIIKILSYIKL